MDDSIIEKLTNFAKAYPAKKFSKGHTIIWSNEEPPGVIFLRKGNVGQYDISDDGQKLVLNIFKPPAFFPMSWAINRYENKYFFEGLSDIECHIAPADEVVEFLKSNNDVTLNLLSRVYRGTDGLLEKLSELMAGTAKSKLLLEILISTHRFGKIYDDGSAQLTIRVTQLSERTGLARETVSRELKKLESEKIITRSKAMIKINNIKKIA